MKNSPYAIAAGQDIVNIAEEQEYNTIPKWKKNCKTKKETKQKKQLVILILWKQPDWEINCFNAKTVWRNEK